MAFVNYMGIPQGRYKLYFMRIESDQRVIYNSRLDVLGQSNIFSVSNIVTQEKSTNKRLTLMEILGGKDN